MKLHDQWLLVAHHCVLYPAQVRRSQVRDRSHRTRCFGLRFGGGHAPTLRGIKAVALNGDGPVEVASDWVDADEDEVLRIRVRVRVRVRETEWAFVCWHYDAQCLYAVLQRPVRPLVTSRYTLCREGMLACRMHRSGRGRA